MHVHVQLLSHVWIFVTSRTIAAHQAPLSMEFPRPEILEQVPISYLKDLPKAGIKPASPVSPALAGGFFTEPPGKPQELKRER